MAAVFETDGAQNAANDVAVDVEQRTVANLHVRLAGAGPPLLLLHGTGSTGASWQGLLPALAPHYRLVVPDLPGHGASRNPGRGHFSPGAMASAVAVLLRALDLQPQLVCGHSAGAAVLVSGLASGALQSSGLIALNPALLPFSGVQQALFAGSAKLLSRLPFAAHLIASRGRDPGAVDALLRGVGSSLPERELDRYRALMGEPEHIRTVLMMMAEWDLPQVASQLAQLQLPTLLLGGLADRAIPPAEVRKLGARMPAATVSLIPNGGHLLQEELPGCVARRLLEWVNEQGLAP